MKKNACCFSAFVCALFLLGTAVFAAPFDPLFKIVKVTGDCAVRAPDSEDFSPAEEGKAYPYGTKMRTGRNSSAIIAFSDGNQCRVLARASLAITEKEEDASFKLIKLEQGKISLTLQEDYHETNELNVETATAICGAIGSDYDVTVTIQDGLIVVYVTCSDGSIWASGADFRIPLMLVGDSLTITGSRDGTFVRLKVVDGEFRIHFRNADGEEETVDIKAGYVVKIWSTVSPDGTKIVVTILIISPNEEVIKTILTTKKIGDGLPGDGKEKPGDGAGTGQFDETDRTKWGNEESANIPLPGSDDEQGEIIIRRVHRVRPRRPTPTGQE